MNENPDIQSSQESLRIVRRFDVAPEVVFDTFTRPSLMRVWWTEQTTFDIDLQVGGRWTIIREDDDVTYTMMGEYLEVERPHRLRYTIAMPQFSPNVDTITIDIVADAARGCRMTFAQHGTDIAEELAGLPPGKISESEKGWQQGFDLMETAWSAQGISR